MSLMKILADTSVWIEANKDSSIEQAILQIVKKHKIVSCEMIDVEIDKACKFLKEKGIPDSDRLRSIYSNNKGEIIPSTDEIRLIIKDYTEEGKKLELKADEMQEDFAIVASASLKAVDLILTFNRFTMASDLSKLVYTIVNSRRNLKIPQFITDRSAIKKLPYV